MQLRVAPVLFGQSGLQNFLLFLLQTIADRAADGVRGRGHDLLRPVRLQGNHPASCRLWHQDFYRLRLENGLQSRGSVKNNAQNSLQALAE